MTSHLWAITIAARSETLEDFSAWVAKAQGEALEEMAVAVRRHDLAGATVALGKRDALAALEKDVNRVGRDARESVRRRDEE